MENKGRDSMRPRDDRGSTTGGAEPLARRSFQCASMHVAVGIEIAVALLLTIHADGAREPFCGASGSAPPVVEPLVLPRC